MPKVKIPDEKLLKVAKTEQVEVDIDTVKVDQFLYDFHSNVAMINISMCDCDGLEVRREGWMLQGTLLSEEMKRMPAGESILVAMDEALEHLVGEIENTPKRKEALCSSGELRLSAPFGVKGLQ